jgi:hypothetical protein
MAAVTPQTILYKFSRYCPSGSSVEAATSQSRWSLAAMAGQRSGNKQETKTLEASNLTKS